MGISSLSTAFSGINAQGTADCMIAGVLSRLLGEEVPPMKFLSAVEKHNACIEELKAHPSPPEHIFTEMEDFWVDSMKGSLK
eukprot:15451484-Alexandrium_andersonii.AAC.1